MLPLPGYTMAGHSQWKNIQHRKVRQDALKSKLFTKLIREITMAARLGGPDVRTNTRLQHAYDKGMSCNLSKEAFLRAVQKGMQKDAALLETVVYEGYTPMGVAWYISCLTDNRNRALSDVRHAFSRVGGSLGEPGCVAYLFETLHILHVTGCSEDSLLNQLSEDVRDIRVVGDGFSIETTQSDVVYRALTHAGITVTAEVIMRPMVYQHFDAIPPMVQTLSDALNDLDDVQCVYHNANTYIHPHSKCLS
jgi:YebC/PmpR family DNA-binding regulatory protein